MVPGVESWRRPSGGSKGRNKTGPSFTRRSSRPTRSRWRHSSTSTPRPWPDVKLLGINAQPTNPPTKQTNKQINKLHLERKNALAEMEERIARSLKKRKVEPAAPSALSAPQPPAPSAENVNAPAARSICNQLLLTAGAAADGCLDDRISTLMELGVHFDDRIMQAFLQLHNADACSCSSLVRRMQRDLRNGTVRNATGYFRTSMNNLRWDLDLWLPD